MRILFRKRDRIQSLENQIYGLVQQLERKNFSYQLTVPIITTYRGVEDIRFSGSPEAIEQLRKTFDFNYKKRKQ